jgi:hypothetical protein
MLAALAPRRRTEDEAPAKLGDLTKQWYADVDRELAERHGLAAARIPKCVLSPAALSRSRRPTKRRSNTITLRPSRNGRAADAANFQAGIGNSGSRRALRDYRDMAAELANPRPPLQAGGVGEPVARLMVEILG